MQPTHPLQPKPSRTPKKQTVTKDPEPVEARAAPKKRKSSLQFVAHFTPRDQMTDEDHRNVLAAFYLLHGMHSQMPADVACPVDNSKTWHGMQREADKKETNKCR